MLLCSNGIFWRDLNLLLTNCTDHSPPRAEALKGQSTQYGVDQNARTASSRMKKGVVTLALSATILLYLVRRLENKPIHLQVLFHNVKIRRENEKKNAFKCLSHFTYYLLTKHVEEKRDKRLKTAFHFDLKFQMENALFLGLHLQ